MKEVDVLQLLADQNGPLKFCRWEEVRGKSFPTEYLDEMSAQPKLDVETERLLEHLCNLGFVDALKSWDTDEGRVFQITKAGVDRLHELRKGRVGRFADDTVSDLRARAPRLLTDWIFGGVSLIIGLFVEHLFGIVARLEALFR